MSLVHGQSIEAPDVESEISWHFDARRFASLCNDIAWAIAGKDATALPSFTERVNVRDDGIDAAWDADLPDHAFNSPLLGQGWNVFQYKQRNIFAQGRDKTFSTLKSGLKHAARDLHQASRRRPDRYVLFTNIDITHDQKGELREVILDSYDQPDTVTVEVVGAAELKVFINQVPHLRSAYFVRSRFADWQTAWGKHKEQAHLGLFELVGQDKVLTSLRSFIEDDETRVIMLTGPQGVGKSRIALQAVEGRNAEAVIALDGDLNVSDLLALETPVGKTIVIVNDPSSGVVDALIHAASTARLKLIICVPTEFGTIVPDYGLGGRIRILPIPRLPDGEAHDLLNKAHPAFDYSLFSWVIGLAGGIPRILLLAAQYGEELRAERGRFLETIAEGMTQWIQKRLGDETLRILSLLSLLSEVRIGVSRTSTDEISPVCELFGGGTDANAVLNSLDRLERVGFLRTRYFHAHVQPQLLANHLASRMLRGRYESAVALFNSLGAEGQTSFTGRLFQLKDDEVATRFRAFYFSDQGLLKDFASALDNVDALLAISGVEPQRTADMVLDGLAAMTLEERLTIEGTQRRTLVCAIEQLLCRRWTAVSALRSLALLAEAENEEPGDNATRVFSECFAPLHPQIPLALSQRLDVLAGVLGEGQSIPMRLAGIHAIVNGVDRVGMSSYRESRGPDPFDKKPYLTWGEVFDYLESLVEHLLRCAHSVSPEIAEAARVAIPNALISFAVECPPHRAVPFYERVVGWALGGRVVVPIADLAGAIRSAEDAWAEIAPRQEGEEATRIDTAIQCLKQLAKRMEGADFPLRLRRWAGRLQHDDYDEADDEDGERRNRYNIQMRALAREVTYNPALLTGDLLVWLCQPEAEFGPKFLYWLGCLDTSHLWFPAIEELAVTATGAMAFAAYCDGIAEHDPAAVERRLDYLTSTSAVVPEALVLATRWLPARSPNVERLVTLMRDGRADPAFVGSHFANGRWLGGLSPEDCLTFLEAVAGNECQHAAAVINFLEWWLKTSRPVENDLADLAWECLGAEQYVGRREFTSYDSVAQMMAKSDIEGGFRLLDALLSQRGERPGWVPLEHMYGNAFWHFLRNADQSRAIRILLTSLRHTSYWGGFASAAKIAFVLEEDIQVLVDYAAEGQGQAEVVCRCLHSSQPGFWPVAFAILARYPTNEGIRSRLSTAVFLNDGIIIGNQPSPNQKRLAEIQSVLSGGAVPSVALGWLSELKEILSADYGNI